MGHDPKAFVERFACGLAVITDAARLE